MNDIKLMEEKKVRKIQIVQKKKKLMEESRNELY